MPLRHRAEEAIALGRAAVEKALEPIAQTIARACEGFDVFITVDRNLPHQQNVRSLPIAIVVVHAKTNRLADLLPLVANLLAAISAAKPGVVATVSA